MQSGRNNFLYRLQYLSIETLEYRVQSHKRTKSAMKKGPVVVPLTFFIPFQRPKIWR